VESSLRLSYEMVSQAEALWESKSQIAGLACQDTRYKGPGRVYQAARLNKNNNQLTHNFHPIERSHSRATNGVSLRYARRIFRLGQDGDSMALYLSHWVGSQPWHSTAQGLPLASSGQFVRVPVAQMMF